MSKPQLAATEGKDQLVLSSPTVPPEGTAPPDTAQGGSRILAFLRNNPKESIALLGPGLVGGLGLLGFATLRARERLIGIRSLSYPPQYLLLTGLDSVGSLLWQGLATFVAPHPALGLSALALLALSIGLLTVSRVGTARPAVGLAALTVSTALLAACGWLYAAAIHSGLDPPPLGQGLECAGSFTGSPDRLVAFETCSWLMNDTPANEGRRRGLGGLLGWLVFAALAGAWAGMRAVRPGRPDRPRWRRGLAALHGLLALFFLSLLPAAHAISEWGMSYPEVELRDKPICDPVLARAISQRVCCASNVAAGAQGVALFLWGSGCPGGTPGFLAPDEVKAIGPGCLIEHTKTRPIKSRCL